MRGNPPKDVNRRQGTQSKTKPLHQRNGGPCPRLQSCNLGHQGKGCHTGIATGVSLSTLRSALHLPHRRPVSPKPFHGGPCLSGRRHRRERKVWGEWRALARDDDRGTYRRYRVRGGYDGVVFTWPAVHLADSAVEGGGNNEEGGAMHAHPEAVSARRTPHTIWTTSC